MENALTPFMKATNQKFVALHENQARQMYEAQNENISLMSEYWGHNDPSIQKEFVKNENIVRDLTEKLKTAKESEVSEIMNHLRKYKRVGVQLHGFTKQDKVNEKTGEIEIDPKTGETLESCFVRFYDPYNGKLFRMGQAVVIGTFLDMEKELQKNGASAIGIAFDLEFVGRQQNSKNEYNSDHYEIKPSVMQPMQTT